METATANLRRDHRNGRSRRRRAGRMLALLLLASTIPLHAAAPLLPVAQQDAAAAGTGVRVDSAAVRDVFDPLPGVSADGADWRAAVATVPDPVESRLARSFDIEVATLVRSFQFSGYVLQGHAMPWPRGGTAQDDDASPRPYRSTPGVLVFRHDAWRDPGNTGPRVRYFVLYLVGESPTFGVQQLAFCRAVRQAAALDAGGTKPGRSDGGPTCMAPAATPASRPVTVLGPTFSGSLASIAGIARNAGLHLDLMSPSATVASNRRIAEGDPTGRYSIHYRTFAVWDQQQQMSHLFAYLERVHGICPGDVAVLAEESAFGQGSEESQVQLAGEQAAAEMMDVQSACAKRRQPTYLQFPQNIAGIRAEHATIEREAARNPRLAPRRFLELDMRDAGASLDLPPVYQPLSTRSDELSLQQLMDTLGIYVRPRAVMVVATDVRDRLFMLSVVRRAVPGAIPAALEGDHLLTHPDYRRTYFPEGRAVETPASDTEAGTRKTMPPSRRQRSTLIAADFRVLALNLVLPVLVAAAGLALLASGWLLLSSRPGRSVLPPVRYALRETGRRLDRLLRPRAPGPAHASRASAASGRRRHSAGAPACLLLGVLALAALLLFALRWQQLLAEPVLGALDLIHGRDHVALWAMALLYLWFAMLVLTRVRAWNRRCADHLLHAPAEFDAGRYLGRRYVLSSLLLAVAAVLPPLAYWGSRMPDAVDGR